jgi:hypothetical protein
MMASLSVFPLPSIWLCTKIDVEVAVVVVVEEPDARAMISG